MESHRTTPRLKLILRRLGAVALILAIIGAPAFLNFTFCPMALIAGIPCPGCGMTRATLAALRGDFAASFRFHPLAFLMVPLFASYVIAHAISYVRHGVSKVDQMVTGKWVDRVLVLFILLMLGVWIARFFGYFGGPAPV